MNKQPKVSIIIPLYTINKRFFSDLRYYEKLEYKNFELVIVVDRKVRLPKLKKVRVKLILTRKKRTGPAEKRDIAIKKATSSICAFIDDDAYPDSKWLKNAVVHFQHPLIAAVGGPGLTPKEDDYWSQLTGLVYGSFFCGGQAQYRFVKGKMQFVDDYPAYNLLVRTRVLRKVGGYKSYFYGGEDTFLCLKIIKKGLKILYDPEVVVYHHRRALFVPYLRQIANIGKHRGFFAKKYPETSLRFTYFVPSILALGFFSFLFLPFLHGKIIFIYTVLLLSFLLTGFLSVIRETEFLSAVLVSFGIITTHIIYGTQFILGLLSRERSINLKSNEN